MNKILRSLVLVLAFCISALIFLSLYKKDEDAGPKKNVQALEEKPKPEELVSEKNRFVLRATWLNDAKEVAEKSGDSEAMGIISFIEKNSALSEPTPQGARLLESGNGPLWFSFVPIVVGDDSMGPMWEKYYSPMGSGGVANFQPDARGLVIKSHIKMTPFWRGIILLHEGRHAREFITRQYDWKDTQMFCGEERDTHDFQNRVTLKLGGKRYHDLVLSLAMDIEGKLKTKGYKPGQAVVHRSSHIPELEEIFTPAQSTLEKDYRESSVWIHANFLLLEQTFGVEAPEKKALYLKTIYSGTGILPD